MWGRVHSATEWLLNKYLARYLVNVNLHQVHVGLTQGSVVLENLRLREDALENFNLPFKIIDGSVGRLELQIPVAGLSSGCLVLCLSKLYILASPYQGTEYDPEKEGAAASAALKLRLEALEQQILQRLHTEAKGWLSSLASSYTTSLIENLKVVIDDVHFCYKDEVSLPSMPFSLGVTIEKLATHPSPAVTDTPDGCVLKEVELENLGVYWNFGRTENQEKSYVLEPISATVQLTQNKSLEPLNSMSTPRFTAALILQTLELTLTSRQYHALAQLMNIIDWQRRVKMNLKWHPGVPVASNARNWWQFAINAVRAPITDRMERERPSFVMHRAKLLVQYVNLYMQLLSKPEIKELIKKDLAPLEEGLVYEELYLMRSLALNRVQRSSPAPARPSQQGYWSSWMPVSLGGWSSNEVALDEDETAEEPVDYSLFFDKDLVFAKVTAQLHHGSMSLLECHGNAEMRPLVEFSCDGLAVGLESRMRTDTVQVTASLQDITLNTHSQEGSLFPSVISRSKLRQQPLDVLPVVDVFYELNPVTSSLDLLLRVTTQPLDMVYNEDIIDRVTNFFALDPTIDYVVEAALAKLGELRSKTKHQLRSTIDKMFSGKLRDFRRWDILLNINAPLVILPQSFTNQESAVVVVDLGHVMIQNSPLLERPHTRSDTNGSDYSNFSTPPSTPNHSLTDLNSYNNSPSRSHSPVLETDSLYEYFSLRLSDLRVHAGSFEEMMHGSEPLGGRLLDKFSMQIKLERRLLFSLDPLHPNILISANIPSLSFDLDLPKLRCLFGVMRSLKSGEKPDRVAVERSGEEEEGEHPAFSKSLQSSMSPETLMHTHLIDVKLSIAQINTIVKHGTALDLELHIDDVELAYSKRPFDSELSLLISTLTLCDRTQPFGHAAYMMGRSFPLADTPASQWYSAISVGNQHGTPDALIIVGFNEIGPDYPGEKEESHTRSIDIKLNYFDLLPHHITLAHLLGFIKRLSSPSTKKSASGGEVREEVRVAEWSYCVQVVVEHVSVGLLDPLSPREKIGTAAMLGVTLDARVTPDERRVDSLSLSVGRVQLRELGNDKCILGLGEMTVNDESLSHQAFQLTVEKGADTNAKVNVGSLQYFHSPRFTGSVISSVNSLLLLVEEQLVEISTRATQAAQDVITYGLPGQGHVYFTVLIESPVIELPRCLESLDILVGHVGNITISNKYPENTNCNTHQVLIHVDNIHLYSAKLPKSSTDVDIIGEQPILHDTTLEICLEQTQRVLESQEVVTCSNIKAQIPQGLKVTVSKQLYEQLLETLRYATSFKRPTKRVRTTSASHTRPTEPSRHKDISANFGLPVVYVLIQGDLLDQDTPNLAEVKFQDFNVSWQSNQGVSDLFINLHKLNIIDLLEPANSVYKNLFRSRHKPRLPVSLDTTLGSTVPNSHLTTPTKKKKRKISESVPLSPYKTDSDMEALVSIRITDKVVGDEDSKGKCVLVDLNCVDMTINLQTWVMLLDFLCLSPSRNEKVIRGSQAVNNFLNEMSDPNRARDVEVDSEEPASNVTVCIQMKEWNLTLHKKEYPLALCQIEGVALDLTLNPVEVQCSGKMERVAVKDLSPHAGLYVNKFTVLGDEVLQFQFLKMMKEDLTLERSCDAELNLQLCSVRYVHTKRFLSELLAFLDHFNVLFTSLQVNRNAVITGEYNEQPKHGMRMVLNIMMSSPVVVVPVTYSSAHILVGYPGNIEVKNSFRFATLEETLESTQESGREMNSIACLLDCIEITLKDMDVMSGVWGPDRDSIIQTKSLLSEQCLLDLTVRRNLDSSFNHSAPNLCVRGNLSTANIKITEADLAKVKGFLGYNLAEDTGEFEISREHIRNTVNVTKLDLDGGRCWLDIDVTVKLDNVSIEMIHRKTEHSLAKFDLIMSSLAFQTYSNKHSVFMLKSQLVTLQDTRPAGGSAFPLVVTHREGFDKACLQVEINMRNTPSKKHWSIVLNKVKIHAIIDFLTLVNVFVMGEVSSPERLLAEHITGLPPVAPAPVKEQDLRDFDINLSITNTEFVLPENITLPESQAVVLTMTTILVLRQQYNVRPTMSINFDDIQMFSCTCGHPDTALSIMDLSAMSIDLCHDIGSRRTLRPGTVANMEQCSALDVQLQNVNTKLSYQDALLFYNILESSLQQFKCAQAIADELCTANDEVSEETESYSVEMSMEGVTKTLQETSKSSKETMSATATKKGVHLVGIEVRSTSISLCVIDDYGDRDVPLTKILLAGFQIWYDFKDISSLSSTLMVDYYNSYVSGWEPLVEPWKFDLHLVPGAEQQIIKVDAADTLNINLTYAMYTLGTTTVERLKPVLTGEVTVDRNVVRKPFIPFVIRNRTGHLLRFATETKVHPLNDPNPFSSVRPHTSQSEWSTVVDGEEKMFDFVEQNAKVRHRETHSLSSRSLKVCVGDWEELTSLSVDKVGTFFRDARPSDEVYDSQARLVFDLTLEEGARKCITVRSALSIFNNTNCPMEVLLQTPLSPVTPSQLLPLLMPGGTVYVPISRTSWLIRARPHGMGYQYSTPIKWETTTTMNRKYECLLADAKGDGFYFITAVKRGNYPKDKQYLPAHSITLDTPLRLSNELPVDITYRLLSVDKGGVIKATTNTTLYDVDPSNDITFQFSVDGFPEFLKVVFPYSTSSNRLFKLMLFDDRRRRLQINLRAEVKNDLCWNVTIFVKYIIVNLTIYPLVISQQSSDADAAGQYGEHETARSMHPHMFDFCYNELPKKMSVRIGKNYRKIILQRLSVTNHFTIKLKPYWSDGIDLTKVGGFFSLKCGQGGMRPEKVFDIGYECVPGTGLLSNTTTVKLVSRYHLENQSSHTLLYGQWFQTNVELMDESTIDWPSEDEPVIEARPDSIVPFTWPRNDMDQLLCVKIPGIIDCGWSGGFHINNAQSDVVAMKGSDGRQIFIQCTVVLQGSSFHVVFADFNDLPSPYRIENHSFVAVQYIQKNCRSADKLLEPGAWSNYYWEEPVLQDHTLLLKVKGGTSLEYRISPNTSNMMHTNALVYENAMYICLSETWIDSRPIVRDMALSELRPFYAHPSHSMRLDDNVTDQTSTNLVLDVPQGQQVLLKHYNPHSQSQLWQLNESGQLIHFKTKLCLDIPGRPPNSGTVSSLILRSIDPARVDTQTWKLSNGRLSCGLSGLSITCRNNILKDGTDAALSNYSQHNPPPKLQFQSLRPGCGALVIQSEYNGPTKVLKILDAQQGQREVYTLDQEIGDDDSTKTLQLCLAGGLGLSIVNHLPEELMYISLSGVNVVLQKSGNTQGLTIDLAHFQVDNQCREALVPVVLHPIKREGQHSLHVGVEREVRGGGRLVVFKDIQAFIADCSCQLDEVLLLKLIQFFEADRMMKVLDTEKDELDHRLSDRRLQYNPVLVSNIALHETQFNVSLIVAPMLEEDLKELHTKLGLRSFLNFSDVHFTLHKYHASNMIAAPSTIQDDIVNHYKKAAANQWLKVVVSSEMTGNMGGLFNDLFTGLSVGLLDGDVPGMVKNVAHGMSDTASKLSSTASTMLAYASADEQFRANRDRLRASRYQSSSDSLRAGWAGLRTGILSGITSVPVQVVKGISDHGAAGAFTGLAKGLIGTVTKPAAGLLDFASGTTAAITQGTRSTNNIGETNRIRLPRCCSGPGEILPRYSSDLAQGMATMWKLNQKSPHEKFISWSIINTQWKILISTQSIRIIKRGTRDEVAKLIELPNIGQCVYFAKEVEERVLEHYLAIDIFIEPPPPGQKHLFKPDSSPRLRCTSAKVSLKVSQDIQYAIDQHYENLFIVKDGKLNLTTPS